MMGEASAFGIVVVDRAVLSHAKSRHMSAFQPLAKCLAGVAVAITRRGIGFVGQLLYPALRNIGQFCGLLAIEF